ncbi:hypothetical protein [Pseudobutyrivibrio sp.]
MMKNFNELRMKRWFWYTICTAYTLAIMMFNMINGSIRYTSIEVCVWMPIGIVLASEYCLAINKLANRWAEKKRNKKVNLIVIDGDIKAP